MVKKEVANLSTFLTVLVTNFFFSNGHGDQNSRTCRTETSNTCIHNVWAANEVNILYVIAVIKTINVFVFTYEASRKMLHNCSSKMNSYVPKIVSIKCIFEIQGQKTNFNLIMLAQTNQRQQSFIYLNWFNSIILTSVKVDVSDRSVT